MVEDQSRQNLGVWHIKDFKPNPKHFILPAIQENILEERNISL